MKKLVLLAIAIVAMASCDKVGVAYSLQADGQADGKVEITFPNGDFTTNGDAHIAFDWCNDTTVVCNEDAVPLDFALLSDKHKLNKTARKVGNWVDDTFTVTGAEGNYCVRIKGYVRETATGLTFSIDRTFRN